MKNDPALQAIQILNRTLVQCVHLSELEKRQVLYRIGQLQRRADDPRIFIAFIGEKKAGKTALVRALTGVPLPVAVRECTAAVCEIQIGLDWHHLASYQDGRTETYHPIDNSRQTASLFKAKEANKQAAEEAIIKLNESEALMLDIQEKVIKAEANVLLAKNRLDESETQLTSTLGAFPWIWKFIGWLSFISSGIRKNLQAIAAAEEEKNNSKLALMDAQDSLTDHRDAEIEAKSAMPKIWKSAKDAAAKTRQEMDHAQIALDEINSQNESKFAAELAGMIDVAMEPAEKVTIYTPNENIPNNVVLLDTPGFNTELQSHRRRAWEAIEEMADICILVSDLRQPMPDTALNLLERLEPYCPTLHVALTKTDLALAEAKEIGDDPQEEIAEAEKVARDRIKRRWERPMHIWTVASVRESDQLETRHLFKSFWKNLPANGRAEKSRLLGGQAIKEIMEMITVHLQRLQDNLEKFDDIASDLTMSISAQVSEKDEQIQEKSLELIQNVKSHANERLQLLEEKWNNHLQAAQTKRDLTERWDALQSQMEDNFTRCAQESTYELELGVKAIAQWLSLDESNIAIDDMPIEMDIDDDDDGQPNAIWLWTAASVGVGAGAAIGFALTSSVTAPLLLAAGAGGLANMLLAPLADAKTQLIEKLEKATQQEVESIQAQLKEMESKIISSVRDEAEEMLKLEIKSREELAREEKIAEIKGLQRLWNSLFDTRHDLLNPHQEPPSE